MIFDIVAYTYKADTYCPSCVVARTYIDYGASLPALEVYSVETRLTLLADSLGTDRMDESTFDSGDFPKVVFASQVEEIENCCVCGSEI